MDISSPIARVRSIDHIVLTVASIDHTVAWYTKHLGVQHERFDSKDGPRHALVFGSQKINLHQAGAEFEPKAQHVQPGSGDLCFITDTPVDEVLARLKEVEVLGGVLEGGQVVERTGARGKLRSVYIRDPDGNLVE
jgi:catechol 2,3-dioxygenase-like lactoylglutathione lyase family enzyme